MIAAGQLGVRRGESAALGSRLFPHVHEMSASPCFSSCGKEDCGPGPRTSGDAIRRLVEIGLKAKK
jgi:hypothetical protein